MGSNENKMSDGGRGRASLGVEVWKSSHKWSVRRSAVRSIAWVRPFASLALMVWELEESQALDAGESALRGSARVSHESAAADEWRRDDLPRC
jgi:hypothetical protein